MSIFVIVCGATFIALIIADEIILGETGGDDDLGLLMIPFVMAGSGLGSSLKHVSHLGVIGVRYVSSKVSSKSHPAKVETGITKNMLTLNSLKAELEALKNSKSSIDSVNKTKVSGNKFSLSSIVINASKIFLIISSLFFLFSKMPLIGKIFKVISISCAKLTWKKLSWKIIKYMIGYNGLVGLITMCKYVGLYEVIESIGIDPQGFENIYKTLIIIFIGLPVAYFDLSIESLRTILNSILKTVLPDTPQTKESERSSIGKFKEYIDAWSKTKLPEVPKKSDPVGLPDELFESLRNKMKEPITPDRPADIVVKKSWATYIGAAFLVIGLSYLAYHQLVMSPEEFISGFTIGVEGMNNPNDVWKPQPSKEVILELVSDFDRYFPNIWK